MRTMRSVLERETSHIRDGLFRMVSLVDTAIENSIEALKHQDVDLAQEIIEGDAEINASRDASQKQSLVAIATQKPAAGDLRAIVAAMSIVTELERMGDHAEGTARSRGAILE